MSAFNKAIKNRTSKNVVLDSQQVARLLWQRYVSKPMKIIKVIAIILFASNLSAETLVTASYKIELSGCGEGVVSCEQMPVFLTNKATNEVTEHIGETMHSLCKDGITPCQFRGYQFPTEQGHFIIYADGMLEVNEKSGQAILVEEGKWSY